MDIITFNYPEIARISDIKDSEMMWININGKIIKSSRIALIMISRYIHDEYLRDNTITSVNIYVKLACTNTIDIVSDFINKGILKFENDLEHNRDLYEIGKKLFIEYLIKIFCNFTQSYQDINEENFCDIYDCALIENDNAKIEECISFFASKMSILDEEYKIKTIQRYGYDFLERTLMSKSLTILSEDSLVQTIISLSEFGNSFFCLLNHIRVELCSKKVIENISKYAEEHNLESVTNQVFEQALIHRTPIPRKLEISHSFFIDVDRIQQLKNLEKTKDDYERIYEVLEQASSEDDILTIKIAVKEKYSDVRDYGGYNMILEAACRNNLSLVKNLFNNGADIRSRCDSKRTILHYFCMKGDLEGVKFALNFIDINDKGDDDFTPLHDAINYSQEEICEYLCAQPNIEKNVKNNYDQTPLEFAVLLNKQHIVEILQRNEFT
ncbi:hypothetical protein TVAG_160940 [Trichomonas vaginalis G3]|uniref:Uncharacterized protein n=1 Tax=Trichomonas vaginalis (strain ATCC PRA-98 / G3) TaxID=412133 RepID=A2E4U9_TRIV3|nr:proteasome regulatory particle assembly [Trichomonas vaginalis G3]EAY12288.1 hypothetical protein TVAG_160940 [Trichomonas vaginalis G3]KAI5552402.1 proteasome regulatory particle assembly [Trichomonas vaginalis G3]|eukprot:XP_001324511.1 hypothetical protein [Trichomonas vaginalis G3]